MPGNTTITQTQFLTKGKLTQLCNPSGNYCQEVLGLLTNDLQKKKKKFVTFTLETISVLLNNSVPRAQFLYHQPDSNEKAEDVSACEDFPRQNLKELQFAGQRRKSLIYTH